MELIEEGIFVSTTFGGEALSMVGSMTALKILEKPGAYDYIWKLGTMLKEGLESLIEQYELEDVILVSGLPPHCGVEFEDVGSLDYLDINSIYSQAMIHNGVITVGINNINLSHTEKEIEVFLTAAEEAMVNIKKAIEQDSTEGILIGKKVDPVFKRNIVEEN